jgi:hypothetical protein
VLVLLEGRKALDMDRSAMSGLLGYALKLEAVAFPPRLVSVREGLASGLQVTMKVRFGIWCDHA